MTDPKERHKMVARLIVSPLRHAEKMLLENQAQMEIQNRILAALRAHAELATGSDSAELEILLKIGEKLTRR